MTVKKKVIILLGMVAILVIGGMAMFNSFTGKDEPRYKHEQDRMVEYLAQNYEGIEKVEFKNFEKNTKTGYYTSVAEIDDQFEVTFYERGAGGEISLDYYTREFIIQYPRANRRDSFKGSIKVVYYGE
ncbi:hypothetical protein KVF93_04380 [Streptococcus equi subsp. zooepidemicus]|uniref:hypothetical protein n=1 Tax=Streptococcus equi TaxID=1336 RepID=UPI0010FD7A11|nr:hypothetical protein [Streptococcus equi]MCD3388080.1 hypothetical protein [Streptococcus equi subsp. zooepidemicus]MCD3411345.1 hypothetical protein [Streptococcus equi subsp. zooepidemicus]MCD3453567.1 hypothetical protein [Streptococcus equi subsp. zooepidemicus]MDI6076586.1 hypothetical protein [Streptococcus equi subsp. zooepidemicus]HEL0633751.1 hypothetical protein [Streptococcus equi subsp. zooepidemicus]